MSIKSNPLLGISQTETITGIKRNTLRRWWQLNKLPKPTDFNGRMCWPNSNFGGAA